ncbi:MAG: hypothetical protein ACYTG0_42445 [Planctomycetota bacterium]|jgi:hypothetical protein
MGTVTVSRKQRLRKLENEIRTGMEEFYYTGMKLKEIRDDRLYEEDGFETWEKYCRERWEWSPQHVHRLVQAFEYRQKLPASPTGCDGWSERSVRELTRIPDKRQAARVAKKVITEVEKGDGVKLTSTIVKRFVDQDLGIKRPKQKPQRKDTRPELRRYLIDKSGTLEGILENLQGVPKEGWELLIEDDPQLIKCLITVCTSLAALLRKAGR